MKLLETLDRLDLQPEWLTGHGLRVDANQECRKLLATVSKLKQPHTANVTRPPLNPQEVWDELTQANFSIEMLDARQIRTLCVSAVTAMRPEVVRACKTHSTILGRTGCLIGIISAYFWEWGEVQNQPEVESLIRDALRRYEKRNPVALHFKRHADQLISSRAASLLANSTIDDHRSVRDAIKQNYIGLNTKFARAVFSAGIRAFSAQFLRRSRRATDAECGELLNYAIRELFIDEAPREEFYALTEAFIVSEAADRLEQFRNDLRTFVMSSEKLGDPRLPRNAANWAMLSQNAAGKFLSWLARESIIFFFNYVLPNNDRNRRRKDFWLQYYAKVRDFQVALSDRDYRRLQAFAQRHEVPAFSRLNHPTTSAFLLRFGDEGSGVYIVEFSETGNAAYIFTARNFKTHVGSIRRNTFELNSELKHHSKTSRIIHSTGEWEYKARQELAELGIRR